MLVFLVLSQFKLFCEHKPYQLQSPFYQEDSDLDIDPEEDNEDHVDERG